MTALSLPRAGLLVSVRSAEEAEAALRGGADLIDVKEPSRGSLGRADDETIADVVRVVAGRVPVSAAMGELTPNPRLCRVPGVSFAKWGLAGWDKQRDELDDIMLAAFQPSENRCQHVLVAYADEYRAGSPYPGHVYHLAHKLRMPALVIDTYIKDGSTLLDWINVWNLMPPTGLLQRAGVQVALAGSLGLAEISALRSVRPNWFAVRGAACSCGRNGPIDEERVRELKQMLNSFDMNSRVNSNCLGEPGA